MGRVLVLALCVIATGCKWVKPSDNGKDVALVKPIHVQNCKKLAVTTSVGKKKVGFVKRKDDVVSDELVTLAKNEAAKINGDTIVAIGEMVDGSQKFDIYSCQ
ncbi:DUF4156 domain-containing protein [Agarilytica rhodophyticola]|uniref:DUF4156 domain-containing protein n=1 Tax=Agarilytica rhodophyticola TaxID=1737490 RepID=UPI000B34294E|nr:DUF4156 domain-containing protein [Agarilytica rhodophyticola]